MTNTDRKFECSDCKSVCCITPPALSSEEEIVKAKDMGVRIVAVDIDGNYYCSITKDDRGVCPFLSDSDTLGCTIYDNNFGACTGFDCTLKTVSIKDFHILDPESALKMMNEPIAPFATGTFSLEMIEKHNIETVSLSKAIELVNMAKPTEPIGRLFNIYERMV